MTNFVAAVEVVVDDVAAAVGDEAADFDDVLMTGSVVASFDAAF